MLRFPRRLLNHLPATRLTATALEAFLRVAGYALYRAYRGQFVKLLQLVDQSFLAALQQVKGTCAPQCHLEATPPFEIDGFKPCG